MSDLKNSENLNNLSQSEEKYKYLFENAPIGIVLCDINGNIEEINEFTLKLLGSPSKEVTKKINLLTFPLLVNSGISNSLKESIEKKEMLVKEHFYISKWGRKFIMKLFITPIFDENKNIIKVQTLVQDITEQKEAEDKLRKNEENLRIIAENIDDVIWKVNIKTMKFTYISPSIHKFRGFTVEEAINQKPEETMPTESFIKVKTYIENKLKNYYSGIENIADSLLIQQFGKDGSLKDIEFVITLLTDENNEVTEILGVSRDVTNRVKNQKEIELSKKRLECLLNISQQNSDNIQELFDFTLEEAIILTESQIGYILNYDESKKELILVSWSKNIMKECHVLNNEQKIFKLDKSGYWGEVVRQGKVIINNNFLLPDPLKKGFPLGHAQIYKFLSIPVFINKKIKAVVGVANKQSDYNETDATQLTLMMDGIFKIIEQKEYQKQLIIEKEKALIASKTKSQFLANMSHEIRTPMNGIMGFTEILLSEETDKNKKEFLKIVYSSTESLMQIINNILDLSKIESGIMKTEEGEFNIFEITEKLVSIFNVKAKNKNIILTADINKNIPVILKGDFIKLNEILTNLIDNAIKFTNEGNVLIEIDFKTIQETDIILFITISDTGIGIEENMLDKIFDDFVQVENYLTKIQRGTGLGLSIVKKLTNLLGGQIDVTSKINSGTKFKLTIPLKKGKDSLIKYSEENNEMVIMNTKKNILLAEDNKTNQILIKKLIEKMGFCLVIVENGAEAINILKNTKFDLVLMDIQMPLMNGIEATQIIREFEENSINKNIPIIAITAFAMVGDREKFLNAGVDDYISKPIVQKDFFEIISKWIK